jgi:hypothetical protein
MGKVHLHCWRLAKNGLAVGGEIKEAIYQGRDLPYPARFWEILRARTSLPLLAPSGVFRAHLNSRVGS